LFVNLTQTLLNRLRLAGRYTVEYRPPRFHGQCRAHRKCGDYHPGLRGDISAYCNIGAVSLSLYGHSSHSAAFTELDWGFQLII